VHHRDDAHRHVSLVMLNSRHAASVPPRCETFSSRPCASSGHASGWISLSWLADLTGTWPAQRTMPTKPTSLPRTRLRLPPAGLLSRRPSIYYPSW
jgi:hypothetical protein